MICLLRLVPSTGEYRGRNTMRPMRTRSNSVSCSPLRGLGGLDNSYLKFGGNVETLPALPGREKRLVDLLGLAGHVVHEEILAEGIGRGEVGFAAAHFGDFLNEVHEGIVAGEHEGVDHDAGALALVD